MSKCQEAYEKQYGEDFNPDHSPVASVWQAAWNAATKNAVEISDRFDFCGNEILIAEAIEAAVLEAHGKQEPVAWCFVQNGFTHYTDDKRDWYDAVGVEEVTPLYAAPVVQPGYKLLKDTTHDERSWPEDSSHENGAYFCMCHHCGRQFTGYKRRVTCKVCAAVIAAAEGKSNAVAHREAACGRSGGAEC